ncbi:hypothetical protein VTK73DRAFT_9854 [Phialemonium thermophilum]|uniref:Heterokaryon incompatibility domain-containing protein n=1 Tax=Phialemonium thermophilum TaxID=223376 RepID=A0ABR3XIF1_9PEZI
MSRPLYQHQPLVGDRCIRLLRLNGGKAGSLSGELLSTAIEDAPDYDALSYVWGKPQEGCSIALGDRHLPITPNCKDALVHLAAQEADHLVWVDSVCIDQNNILERNHQVAMMADIYGKAAKTIVWLGPGNDNTDEVIAKLNFLKRHYEGVQTSDDERRKYSPPNFPTRNGYCTRTYAFIDKLFDVEWFSRVWTIQEVSLAQKVVLQMGNSSFEWDTLVGYGLPEFTETTILKGPRFEGFNLRTMLFGMRRLAGTGARDQSGRTVTEALPLTDVFFRVKGQGASDPRDKFNALYWIFQIAGLHLPPPDYAKTPEQVFVDAVSACVEKDKAPWFLYMVSGDDRLVESGNEPRRELPSWIPDLASQSTRWRGLFDLDMTLRRRSLGYNQATGAGSTIPQQQPPFSLDLDSRLLRIRGHIVGSVGEYLVKMPKRYSETELVAPSWSAAVDYIRTLRTVLSFPAVRPTLKNGTSTGEEELNIATVFAGMATTLRPGTPTEPRARVWDREWQEILRQPESELEGLPVGSFEELQKAHDTPSWRHKSVWFFEEVYQKEEGMALTGLPEFRRLVKMWFDWRVADVHQTVTARILDNSIFVCNSLLGLGPPNMEKGDFVVQLDGLHFPFAIRETAGGFHLIGPAYVHKLVPTNGESKELVLL